MLRLASSSHLDSPIWIVEQSGAELILVVSKRFVKKQQMRLTRHGAHLLLQTRAQVLNDDLRDNEYMGGADLICSSSKSGVCRREIE